MSGNKEISLEELVAPIAGAALTAAFFTARLLPENRDADPEDVLAEVMEVFKACRMESLTLVNAK